MSVNPITPGEASKRKLKDIPDFVIEAFNDLIVRKFSGSQATVKQDEVVELIMEKAKEAKVDVTRDQLFENHWLDVEPYFMRAGWKVDFDKPGYNESYDAYFVFSKARKRKPFSSDSSEWYDK
jgi:hypothetical protein